MINPAPPRLFPPSGERAGRTRLSLPEQALNATLKITEAGREPPFPARPAATFGRVSPEPAAPDPYKYPALSAYLTQRSETWRSETRRSGHVRPAPTGGPRASTARGHRRHARPRPAHGRRRAAVPASYGYASAALLVFATLAFLAPSHRPTAPDTPRAAPPRQPEIPAPPPEPTAPQRSAPKTPETPRTPARQTGSQAPSKRPEPSPTAAAPEVLRLGSSGRPVVRLQEKLRQLRLYTGPLNGHYDQEVAAAVARMQQARAVPEPLGVCGPATRTAIDAEAL